jgi:hypothetical protein
VRPEEVIASRPWEKPVLITRFGDVRELVLELVTDRLGYQPIAFLGSEPASWTFRGGTVYLGTLGPSDPWDDIVQIAMWAGRDLRFINDGILVMT